jgi:hypothetical protein
MPQPFAKLRPDLDAALAMAKLDTGARARIGGAKDAAGAVAALSDAGLIEAAIKLCAFSLPGRELVWWACRCTAHTEGGTAAEGEIAAREAAEHWVRQRDEDARYASMAAARHIGFKSPHAWSAVAAFWSGGSIAPRGKPAVPPPGHLAGTAAHGAIMLAAVRQSAKNRAQRLERFFHAARDIADGGGGQIGLEAP